MVVGVIWGGVELERGWDVAVVEGVDDGEGALFQEG